ncbi:MAG: glycosyltransferase family 4 protein [Victivallales bacterium]|nr:glycosyltransferase family 4 protein [Victivallales bacterium]
MKIVYFHQHFSTPAGATGTRSYQFSRKLIARGHEVTMVCGSSKIGATGLDATPMRNGMRRGVVDGINVIELDLNYSNYDSLLKRSWLFLKFALKSVRIALSYDYDLLFATSTPLTAGIPGIAMKFFRRRKFVFEVRDLWPELPRAMGVVRNPLILFMLSVLERLSYNLADACIGLSPGIREGIRKRLRNKNKIVEMLPNGCDLDLFKPGGARMESFFRNRISSRGDGDVICLFTGAHGLANGLDAVLDAAGILKKKNTDKIKFVFIGDGKLKPHLQERVKTEKLDNCFFLDPVSKVELAELITCAGIGLMILDNIPAFYYGTSPNKFFDYISAGLPVFNNYPGWLADMIQENNCGTTVKPGDPEAFAAKLTEMAADRDRLREMGKNARRLAEKEFNRDDIAEKFVNLLEQGGGNHI